MAQQVASKYNVKLPSLSVEMRSDIPLARGLGSSSLVGALYIANYFGNIQLSNELLQLATEIEGHPDNVAPFWWLISAFIIQIQKKRM